jgi:hypothetical protein
MREKQEAFDAMKRELDTYAKMQSLFEQTGDSSDPAKVPCSAFLFLFPFLFILSDVRRRSR